MRFFAFIRSPAIALFAVALAGSADAATDLYIFSGTGTGSLNGVAFSNVEFQIDLEGDTSNLGPGGVSNTEVINPLDFAVVQVDGFSAAKITQETRLGINRDTNGFFFSRSSGPDFLDLFVSESDESAFNFSAPYGPVGGIAATNGQFENIQTSQGLLTLSRVSVVTFFAAVPEPETWWLTIIGAGTTGALIRRRKRSSLTPRSLA